MALCQCVTILLLLANSALSSSYVEVSGRLFTHGAESVSLRHAEDAADILTLAWTFNNNGICLNRMVSHEVRDIMKSACQNQNCSTLSTMVRVEKRMATGAVISIRNGPDVVYDIVFKRNVQLRLRHRLKDGRIRWDRFYYEFTVGQWYHMAVTFCPRSGFVMLHVNCQKIYQKFVDFSAGCVGSDWRVCVGKLANGESDHPGFVGSLQNLRIYEGRAQEVCKKSQPINVTLHEQTVTNLRSKLANCRKHYCVHNGTVYANGSIVPHTLPCTRECRCQNGKVVCTEEVCPAVRCPANRLLPANPGAGKCCPSCQLAPQREPGLGNCRTSTRTYSEGSIMYKRTDVLRCRPCECKDRSFICRSVCPLFVCPPGRRYHKPGSCCPVCLDEDNCRGGDRRKCGEGRCVNMPGGHQCHCYPGVKLNPISGRCERPPPSIDLTVLG